MIGGLLSPEQRNSRAKHPVRINDDDVILDEDVVPETGEQRNSRFKHPSKQISDEDVVVDDGIAPEEAPLKPTQFKDQYGRTMDRTLNSDERSAGAALGALEFPLAGFNDEIVGSADALIDQGVHAGAGGVVDLAKRFGIDPKAAASFIGYDEKFKPNTMAEGRAEAAGIKDRYAKARETGEIDFWDADNVASNAGNIAGSIAPYEGIYNLAKGAAHGIPAAMFAGKTMPGWVSTIFGLGGAGAAATAMTEAGNAQGGIDERMQKVYKAGGGPLAVGAILNILGYGAGKYVAVPGAKLVAGALTGPAKAAYRRLAELAHDAGLTIDEIAESYSANQAVKPQTTLAEAGPDWFRGWQGEAGVAARTPGTMDEAAKVLVERQKGSTGRVADDVTKAFDVDGSFLKTFDDLDEAAATAARPLYKQAEEVPPLVSPELTQILDSPAGKGLFQDALEMAQVAQVPLKELVPTANGGFPTKILHFVKKAFDDKVDGFYNAGKPQIAREWDTLGKRFLAEVDRLNPLYKQARAAYASPKANQTAMELGRSMVDKPADYVTAQMARLSDVEKQFFKQGYGQKLVEEIKNVPYTGNPGYRMTNKGAREEGAQAVLGPDVWAKLQRQAQLEARMTDTYGEVAANSKTAQRLIHHDDSNASLGAVEALDAIAHGGIVSIVKKVGMDGIANILNRLSLKAKRAEIAKALFSRDPEVVKKALAAIKEEIPHAEFWKKLGVQGGVSTTGLVTPTGQPLATQFTQGVAPE